MPGAAIALQSPVPLPYTIHPRSWEHVQAVQGGGRQRGALQGIPGVKNEPADAEGNLHRRAKGEGYMQKAGAACKGQGQRAEGARDVDSTGSVQTAGEGPARTCCPRALKTGHSVFRRKYALSTCGPGSVRRRRMHSYKRAFKAATKSAMNRAAPAQVQRPSTQASPEPKNSPSWAVLIASIYNTN
ncbi:hypothetical protein GGX14DRAFT_391904 [Mycena pura]|uniref:Uncharacterized protein n=1 Tax=Mycena pura TaxID=153505 RepID=A0AAD6VKB3_9AGAR|nr:hypothetical protein GGX14DRAFT_391904 [Mycena pura]